MLKLYFQHESYFYDNCLFYILTIYLKCLFCQFLGCGVIMQIPILTYVQIWHISSDKGGCNLQKNLNLKRNFQYDGHFYANCLIYIQTIYCKCLHYLFLGCAIRMQIPILTGVENSTDYRLKMVIFCHKISFEVLFPT